MNVSNNNKEDFLEYFFCEVKENRPSKALTI